MSGTSGTTSAAPSAGALHENLKAAYEDVAYVGRPNHHSHPDRLAAIATLFGLAPPDVASARILEVGCGDGANLVPIGYNPHSTGNETGPVRRVIERIDAGGDPTAEELMALLAPAADKNAEASTGGGS